MRFRSVMFGLLLFAATLSARGQEVGADGNAALQYWQAFSMISPETKELLVTLDPAGDVPPLPEEWVADDEDNPRLEYLNAGATMGRCNWGLDFGKGPSLLIPHVGAARHLAKLSLLRARNRFDHGRSREAIDDVLATFELAKDLGDTPSIIVLLVRYQIEDMAIATLARQLPSLDRATADHLAAVLEPLPADDSFKQVWRNQSRCVIEWAFAQADRIERQAAGDSAKWEEGLLKLRKHFGGGDDQRLQALAENVPTPVTARESLKTGKEIMKSLEEAADLPLAEQDRRISDALRSIASDAVTNLLIRDPQQVFYARRRWQARHAMLDAAVAVVREGETALRDARFADPFGEGVPFEYRKVDGGFELQSKLIFEGEPVTLRVGVAKPKP